ncbi:hypothetical protein [Mariniblastus fucicola]|uniref:Uncharacterized protein n=1 Tax=Mariniblastus fucicola TaxID=980251 RepID=A0A5B9PE36_9BACT|nr:hypothetical protein [Mariniblastus fucicola]QEG24554.1 hypothetical protein MFFC18_44740 [Mariniblastus fucicola]
MIEAVCFNCGAEKSAAIKLCGSCRSLPTSYEDRVASVCLSNECLRQDNLEVATRYIQQKKRKPGFHDKVRRKAEQIVNKMPDQFQISQSFDLSESFFEERFVLDD